MEWYRSVRMHLEHSCLRERVLFCLKPDNSTDLCLTTPFKFCLTQENLSN